MEISRASFFKKMWSETLKILPHMLPSLLPDSTSFPLENEAIDPPSVSAWQEIGTWTDFPVGTQTPVNQGQQILVANERGLYALDREIFEKGDKGPRRPLRLEISGYISIHTQAFWPETDYLSYLTGNRMHEEET